VVLARSYQADPGDVCGLRAVGVDTATDSRGDCRAPWNGGLVRERNGGFRADDLPVVEGWGPMAEVRQPSQTGCWWARRVTGRGVGVRLAGATLGGGRRARWMPVAAAIGWGREQQLTSFWSAARRGVAAGRRVEWSLEGVVSSRVSALILHTVRWR
jgi:hypothetical protein